MNGRELAQAVRKSKDEFKKLCEGIDEETASRAPEGRWSPKQIVSHLSGPDGSGNIATIKTILAEDTPRLDIVAEDPFWSKRRSTLSFTELVKEFDGEYVEIAAAVENLSTGELARKAHIPLLKETPLGEYPTLEQWVLAIVNYHVGMHIGHMREILGALSASQAKE